LPASRLGGVLERLAKGLALAGGAVLLAVMAVTVVSVVGRTAFASPILGDFELVEIGCAVAVFAFLPYCQLRRGNVVVDLFIRRTHGRARLDAAHSLVYAAIAALFAWRLALGGAELRAWGETTMILAVPLWWGFVPIVASAALLVLICIYTFHRDLGDTER
ncbi:MAG: TRAP transporter small permease, partial [Alphaproteobacteria bacterium]